MLNINRRPFNYRSVSTSETCSNQADPSVSQSDVECPMCLCVLDRPVELHCGPLVCAGCCSQWIQSFGHPATPCPCCYSSDPLSIADIRPPPPVVVKLLGNLLVQCRRCNNNTRAENYTLHTQSGCDQHIYVPPITIQDSCHTLLRPQYSSLSGKLQAKL